MLRFFVPGLAAVIIIDLVLAAFVAIIAGGGAHFQAAFRPMRHSANVHRYGQRPMCCRECETE